MKSLKYIAIAVSMTSAAAMASCGSGASDADRQLAELAAASTSTDPSVSYEAKTLSYRYTVAPETFTLIDSESLKEKTGAALRSETNAPLVKALAQAGADIRYVYVCGDDSISFTFTPSDLSSAK